MLVSSPLFLVVEAIPVGVDDVADEGPVGSRRRQATEQDQQHGAILRQGVGPAAAAPGELGDALQEPGWIGHARTLTLGQRWATSVPWPG